MSYNTLSRTCKVILKSINNENNDDDINFHINPNSTLVELIVLLFFICLLAGPFSGITLSITASFAKLANQVNLQYQSTRQLATALIESSAKIKYLEQELAKNSVELANLREQVRDTNSLRKLLDLKNTFKCHTIACDVIGHTPSNWFNQIIIDKGKNDNIEPGFAVINSFGVVGQVIEVSDDSAIVRLLTDPEQKEGVIIKKANATGILVGTYDKAPVINYVPIGQNVEIGEEVVCLGKGGSFPPNQLVGYVSRIARENNGASMQIEVKLAVNIDNLTSVMVIGQSRN